MIKAKNIYKSFGEIPILTGIDLHINESEIVSIVGASGAGKTTLLHILSSLSKPSEPKKNNTTVEINGTDISKVDDKTLSEFRNKHIGFIFQFHQLLPELSALENAMLPALIGKFPKKEAVAKATEILTYLGLAHRLNNAPGKLSGGEQQRVAIARALVNNPKVIFADEPSGNLDSKNATELHQLFFDLRKEFNQTFVIVTHNEELAEMADRKLVMNDGFLISS